MYEVSCRTAGFVEIDLIRPLWEQLNEHHHERSSRFRKHYERMTFMDRRAHFQKIQKTGHLRLDLAVDCATGRYIGYCVSSLSPEKAGEVESLFVEAGYRSKGIGTALMRRALSWMDSEGSLRKRVSIGDGNEAACVFYKKFGFYPRMTVLEQAPGRF